MKVILKLIADLCFYFYIVAVLSIPFGEVMPFFIWFLPPAAYIIYACVRFRSFAASPNYKPTLLAFFYMFVAFTLIIGFAGIDFYFTGIMPIGIIFFVAASWLMRMARHAPDVQKQWAFKAITGGPLMATLIGAGVIAWGILTGAFIAAARFLYFILVEILILIVTIALMPFRSIELPSWAQREDPYVPPDIYFGDEMDDLNQTQYSDMNQVLYILLVSAGVIIIAFVLYKVFKLLTRKGLILQAQAGVEQEYISLPPLEKKTKTPKPNKLRRQYLRFLQACWKRGINKAPHQTTLDYHTLATAEFEALGADQDLTKLRHLYLNTRYAQEQSTTAPPEDVDFAKKLVSRIRKLK